MGTRFLILLFSLFFTCNIYAIGPIKASVTPTIAPSGATNFATDASCEAAWIFDDDLTDESGNSNTLTDGGSVAFAASLPGNYTTGKSAVFVSADSDYLQILTGDQSANFPGKVFTADLTVAFWIEITDTSGNREVWSFHGDHRGLIEWDENLRLSIDDGGGNVGADAGTIPTGDWIHVVVSFDGSETKSTTWMSTDGGTFGDTVNGAQDTFTNTTGLRQTSDTFYIGCSTAIGNLLQGNVAHFIILSRTVTAAEAEGMYDNGITGGDTL